MKVTVAPDSFKESLASPDAARAIGRGVLRAAPLAEVVEVPMADGGEGTTETMVEATGGSYQTAEVAGPLGRPTAASWGLCGGGRTAVIEMAKASGLELLKSAERNPMLTSTRGTGQLILAALEAGAATIVVGIGGSATVDGGTGMAAALGVRFLDAEGRPIEDCRGGRLLDVERIDATGLDPRIRRTETIVASDVTNPLTGMDGAAYTYGPQKGATPEQTEELERGLAHLAGVIERDLGRDVADMPGAGAAGGLGAGLVAFLGAELREGAPTVMEAVRLREKMAGSDLVLTGEGRLDRQSAFGKAPAAVAGLAREMGIPAVALAGSLGPGYEKVYDCGLAAVFSITDGPMEFAEALRAADELLARAAESVTRLWLAARAGTDA